MAEGIPGYLVNSNQNNIIGVMKKNYKRLVSEIVIGKTVWRWSKTEKKSGYLEALTENVSQEPQEIVRIMLRMRLYINTGFHIFLISTFR